MTVSVKTLLNLYRFPSGRRLSCLRSMRERLGGPAFAPLQFVLDRAIAAEWETRRLEIRYRNALRRRKSEFSSETSELDAELDRALSALEGACGVALKAYGEDSPRGEAATLLRGELFPQGVRFLIHMPYMEQEAEVTVLLERIAAEPALAQAVQIVGVEDLVDRVAELNLRYGEAIRADRSAESASFDEVRAAREAGHERLCWIVFLAVARLHALPPDGELAEALTAALEVVSEQNAAIKRTRKRRRSVTDVDPEDEAFDDESEEDEGVTDVPALPLREPPAEGATDAA
ncbi:MAG: hypothetical protein R3F62_31885 [Planctomycetota bacterium]